jgi:hypothetical protein
MQFNAALDLDVKVTGVLHFHQEDGSTIDCLIFSAPEEPQEQEISQ